MLQGLILQNHDVYTTSGTRLWLTAEYTLCASDDC